MATNSLDLAASHESGRVTGSRGRLDLFAKIATLSSGLSACWLLSDLQPSALESQQRRMARISLDQL